MSLCESCFIYIFNNSISTFKSGFRSNLWEGISLKKEKLVEVCPVCGNADLYYEVGGYAGKVYHCKECGYMGAFVVEGNEEMVEKIRENYKREKGKGEE